MIARAFPLFILLILVPDTYLYMRIKRKWGMPWWSQSKVLRQNL